eukprot:m.427952 g.427952  ORF g.427952 m.427952 type:complete len:477 (-) comp21366_c0_seq14:379-1809(-)
MPKLPPLPQLLESSTNMPSISGSTAKNGRLNLDGFPMRTCRCASHLGRAAAKPMHCGIASSLRGRPVHMRMHLRWNQPLALPPTHACMHKPLPNCQPVSNWCRTGCGALWGALMQWVPTDTQGTSGRCTADGTGARHTLGTRLRDHSSCGRGYDTASTPAAPATAPTAHHGTRDTSTTHTHTVHIHTPHTHIAHSTRSHRLHTRAPHMKHTTHLWYATLHPIPISSDVTHAPPLPSAQPHGPATSLGAAIPSPLRGGIGTGWHILPLWSPRYLCQCAAALGIPPRGSSRKWGQALDAQRLAVCATHGAARCRVDRVHCTRRARQPRPRNIRVPPARARPPRHTQGAGQGGDEAQSGGSQYHHQPRAPGGVVGGRGAGGGAVRGWFGDQAHDDAVARQCVRGPGTRDGRREHGAVLPDAHDAPCRRARGVEQRPIAASSGLQTHHKRGVTGPCNRPQAQAETRKEQGGGAEVPGQEA